MSQDNQQTSTNENQTDGADQASSAATKAAQPVAAAPVLDITERPTPERVHPTEFDAASDEVFDPENPREFDPTVVLLHLEWDGVIVEGFINPFTGVGVHDLLIRLQDDLVKARARGDGAAPEHQKTVLGDVPDSNALRRQRAAAVGHDIDLETHRCRKCNNAEWWCLDGNPCEPRAETPSVIESVDNGEAVSAVA